MSNFNLSKKLQPAKKVWKKFTTTLQIKLQKPIKKLKHTFTSLPPIRPLFRRKPPSSSTHHHLRRHDLSKPIFVDEMFPQPTQIRGPNTPKIQVTKMATETEEKPSFAPRACVKSGECSNGYSSLRLLPEVRCIDEKAEEFISKFREDMKIEREQSLLDFQEMLARSA